MTDSPLKITFIMAQADFSGGCRVVAVLARRLAARGHRVHVVATPAPWPGYRRWAKGLLRFDRGPRSHLEIEGTPHHVLRRVRPVTDADVPDADVVVATWWETAEWVQRLVPEKGAKAYFVQGHEVWDGLPVERAQGTYRLPMQKIVVSQWLHDLMRDRYGDSHAVLAPNAVDLDVFFAPPRERRRRLTIGFAYSAAWTKGVDVILKALERVRAAIPDVRVVAYGRDEPADSLPLPEGIEYESHPSQARLREIYAACDCWLFGSREEGFGLPILEAMACRTPVVATPAGAAPELVPNGGGVLVGREDDAGMAAAVCAIVQESDDEWRRRSDAALAAARSHQWSDATDRFEAALRLAVERAARGEIDGGAKP